MKDFIILGGQLVTPQGLLPGGVLQIEDGVIRALQPADYVARPGTDQDILDGRDFTIAPGMIDLHTHGAIGLEVADGRIETLEKLSAFYARHGVTGFLAGIGGDEATLEKALPVAGRVCRAGSLPGATLLGIHLEGPFINPQRMGAFNPESILPPDASQFERWLRLAEGTIRLVTLAPELSGVEEVVHMAVQNGVRVSAGHSTATLEQMDQAAGWGVSHITHTYNAMSPFNHREPGIMGAALSDERFTAEIIADGIHVHPAAVRLLVRARGPQGVCLITDSVAAAGLEEGEYFLEGQNVIVRDGSVRLKDGTLCGSMLTMEQGVANLVRFGATDLIGAFRMASRTPALELRLEKKGEISAGMDADLVALNSRGEVQWTMVGGQLVYCASAC